MRRIGSFIIHSFTFLIAYKVTKGLITFISKDMALLKLRHYRKEHERIARKSREGTTQALVYLTGNPVSASKAAYSSHWDLMPPPGAFAADI